jgi:hypothetical protein
MWKVNSVPAGYVRFTNGTTQYTGSTSLGLELADNISGSIYTSGSTLQIQITSSETSFETTKQYRTHTLKVTPNLAYGVTFSTASYTSNWNTNGARPSNYLAVISFGEYQVGIGDTVNHSTFQLVSSSAGFSRFQSGDNYYIYANSNISAGTYTFSASIADSFGKIGSSSATFTVAQASTGSLTTNGTFYVIETARSGALIYTSTNGRTGTQGDLNVNYSPQYNSAAVASFTSSNALVSVTTAGALSIGQNVSGSYTSGQTFTSTITFRDQYNNIGSGSITINVAPNSVPTASFTPIAANLTASISANTSLMNVSISDMETDTPFSMSLGGTNAADLYLVPQNVNSSSYVIKNVSTISTGQTLTYDAIIKDVHGKTRTYSSNTITIASAPVYWYAYLSEGGANADSEANALTWYGDTNDDGVTDVGYPFRNLADGEMGNGILNSIALAGFGQYSFLIASGSSLQGSRTTTLLSRINHATGSESATGLLIVFPSSSNFTLPQTVTNALGGSTSGQYVLFADRAGTFGDSPQSAYLRYFNMTGSAVYPNTSITRFGVMFTQVDSTNDISYFFMASSGSQPTSTF